MLDFNYIEKYRENNRIEAKKALGGLPKSIWETYSAFANTLGGVILLGVEEIDKAFHPINLPYPDQLIDEFWQILNDKTKVSKNIITKQHIKVLRNDTYCFIAIFIPRASKIDLPIYIDKDPFQGTYKRNGEGDYRASKAEVVSMQEFAKEKSADFQFTDVEVSDLNQKSVNRFFENSRVSIDFFKERGICNEQLKSSYAGLLTFGTYDEIKKHFPDFKLSLHNKGTKIFKGNLFDFFIEVTDIFKNLFQDNEIITCLREALLNAITNADYFTCAQVSVDISASHISFKNSGTFTVDIDDAKKGFTFAPRNLLIKKLFDILRSIDIITGGIPYIHMIWQKKGFSAPYFLQQNNLTVLKLYFYNIDFLNDNFPDIIAAEIIISYLTEHIYADKSELKKVLNLSSKDTEKILAKLCKNKVITYIEKNCNLLYKLQD